MATLKPPPPKVGKARSNSSIIAMLTPSRHIFREWTPLPFTVHEDAGLEVGKEIIRIMARRLGMALKASNVVGNPVTLHWIW
jgi:hypothetical protein